MKMSELVSNTFPGSVTQMPGLSSRSPPSVTSGGRTQPLSHDRELFQCKKRDMDSVLDIYEKPSAYAPENG